MNGDRCRIMYDKKSDSRTTKTGNNEIGAVDSCFKFAFDCNNLLSGF